MEVGATGRYLRSIGYEGPLERDDRDFDHVVGWLASRDHLDPNAGRPQPADQGVAPVASAKLQDLVADGGDDGHQ